MDDGRWAMGDEAERAGLPLAVILRRDSAETIAVQARQLTAVYDVNDVRSR